MNLKVEGRNVQKQLPEIPHPSSPAVGAFLDGRLVILLFSLLFAIALLCMWAEKSERQRRERRAARIQTEELLRVYANATKALTAECGYARATNGNIPNIFTNDPGWAGWRGPYVRGDVRSSDYYGTPISFVFSNGTFTQRSAGLDRVFGTSDDLFLAAPLLRDK